MKQGFKQAKIYRPRPLWLGLALPFLLLQGTAAKAQQMPQRDSTGRVISTMPALLGDTVRVRLELQPDSLVAVPVTPGVIDSARLEWLRTPPTMRDLVCDRVGCFETEAPHQFNNSVMAYVTLFTARNRSYMQRVLERENLYFPIFEKYLAQYNLPIDLKYLAVVESALIPTAKSPVGATGLWQFMGPTAGDLRLKRDEWIDERMAPEKATEAACKHLRYLYGVFHDWELVLAAYNWGAGSVQRVMRRTGKKTFWDLYPHMPAETRNYVPTFTAIMYSMKYAEAHGLRTSTLRYQYAEPMDTLSLRGRAFDLRRLSRACGYEDSLYLTRFNPELRRAALPAGYRPYVVRFPAAAAVHFGDADRNTLLDYCQPATELPRPLAFLPPRLDGVEPWVNRSLLAATTGPRAEDAEAAPRFRRVPHKVKRGETLVSLAERFEVSQSQLRRWNELPKGRPLKPGRELVVFVPIPTAAPSKAVETVVVPTIAVAPATRVRPTVSDEEAAARREQAEANAREVARLQELARQEKLQDVRLAAIKQRQAVQQAAAEAQARIAARRLAQTQAAETKRSEAKTSVAAVVPEADETDEPTPATVAETGPYTVRKGDNLTKLAREHNVTVAQLMAWNKMSSTDVVLGQRLVFRAPAGAEEASEAPRKSTKSTALAAAAKPARTESRLGTPKVHLVQPGDTLFNISRRFGVSVQTLRELNHLASDEVKLGQKLLVPQG
ncbi:LysM peptidoglycan-binding domain-containing protein [Microvirga sp. STS02]|uniref:LysM peptidoglycan-binding domain-containing protein n=1 Tax=Hymenobacter negativus TaxID=2795026 RepID=UPI0018DDE7C3|nr:MULTISPECIES: LysM peptidoglycan-binding domain-containing protein [Bacteria]MBH8570241.1 LysM peptidoglycan-binding domain-containing protein [Hymenobacter negativus]MBR7209980.1 LysM peptidoglycan-binding domain-containing protein [Microvirga sp. STS02]